MRFCRPSAKLRREERLRTNISMHGEHRCWMAGPGRFTAVKSPLCFDNAELCPRYSAGGSEALALSWDGNPGHRGLPEWPAYTAQKPATMIFDNQCRIKTD